MEKEIPLGCKSNSKLRKVLMGKKSSVFDYPNSLNSPDKTLKRFSVKILQKRFIEAGVLSLSHT